MTPHQQGVGLLVAVAGALLALAGVAIGRLYRGDVLMLVELAAAADQAEDRPRTLSRAWWRRSWSSFVVGMACALAPTVVHAPWPAYALVAVLVAPVAVADLVLTERCKELAAGGPVDHEVEATFRLFKRGWPYLVALGLVVLVPALLWSTTVVPSC